MTITEKLKWKQGKIANLESMFRVIAQPYVNVLRTSYFDFDFASQMKLTKFPLVHRFV